MFYEWNGYKLRLDALRVFQLEEALGRKSPLTIFADTEMPSLTNLLLVLHYSLQAYQNGIKKEDTYSIFDKYIEDGNTLVTLIPVIIEVFKVSGLIPKDVEAVKDDIEQKK
jgi:hypothetical protein